ncbi:MAG TPA: reverse transcriptase domain-containing protein [Nitrosomonas sp.]|nr:reverse transcriptase domain-containing protein [Nitrosomonas sp.]
MELDDKNHINREPSNASPTIDQNIEAGATAMVMKSDRKNMVQGGEKSTLSSSQLINVQELDRENKLEGFIVDPSNSPETNGTSGEALEENHLSRGGHDHVPEVPKQFSPSNTTIKDPSRVSLDGQEVITDGLAPFPYAFLAPAPSRSGDRSGKSHQVTQKNFSSAEQFSNFNTNCPRSENKLMATVWPDGEGQSSSVFVDRSAVGRELAAKPTANPSGKNATLEKSAFCGQEELSNKHVLLIKILCNPTLSWSGNNDHIVLLETVEANLKKFTKREVEQAEEAVKLFSKLGRPSIKDYIEMIKSNRIKNCPVVVDDVRRALKIWGKDVGVLMGRTVRRRPDPLVDEILHRSETDYTILYMDLFFVNGLAFLLSISKGYNLLVIRYTNDRRRETVEKAILETLSVYKKYNVVINGIISDGEGAMGAMKTFIESQGITVEQASKNEHVAIIERAGRQVKERVRSFVNILKYQLTKQMLIYLIYYLVSMINLFPRSTSAIDGVAPKTKLTGKTLDYEVDCRLEFGDYVHANEDNVITNSMKARTFPAICLGPVGNLQGSYYFMNLNTWQVVKRRQWTKLPLPNEIINKINARAEKEELKLGFGDLRFKIGDRDLPDDEIEEEEGEEVLPQENELQNYGQAVPDNYVQEGPVDYEPHYFEEEEDTYEPNYFQEEEEEALAVEDNDAEPEPPDGYNFRDTEQRRKWREKYGFTLWGETVLNTYNVKKALSLYGDEAKESMHKEMLQLYQKGVFSPVHYNELPNKQKVKLLRTLMFLKRKRNNILKSRFVADGSTQLRFLSAVDPSSPTVSTEALFISSAIDGLERRQVATVDIEGAYLHAKMKGEVYIQIEPVIASILISIQPEYDKYKLPNGSLIMRLDKALYGCIESARLFYEHISKTLKDLGFKPNEYDPCVFNKEMYGKQCTVVVYVDDLKISCADGRGVDDVVNDLKKVYGNVNLHKEAIIDYLGMDFDHSKPGVVKISMTAMIDQVIEELNISETARTPAAVDLFHVDEKSPRLEKDKKEKFHSLVAKLLYMAKRARPDILTAVSFLTTRCIDPTVQDWNKLLRIAKYLKGTRDLALSLCAENVIKINSYIDASFACHPDGKSHTGEMITLGGGAVFSKSSKQKLVAKSSTEAELIGLSDGLPHVLWTKNFLQSQGYDTGPAIVHQDNKSTITLAEKGRSTSNRTRHVSIRYFFVKDRIESNEIKVIHTGTEKMVADFFSKPLQGHAFEVHRAVIMNL